MMETNAESLMAAEGYPAWLSTDCVRIRLTDLQPDSPASTLTCTAARVVQTVA